MKVTPWEVEGDIDYKKLVKEFGIQPLETLPKELEDNILFRRGIVFAHRDIQRVFSAVENKKPFVMMTGLMPTGKFHIGHMIVAMQMILWQKLGAKVYIAVADVEAYHARGQSLEESRIIAEEEYITNYIALGLKPENCEIYFQSERSKIAEKSNAYYRLQNLLARHVTFNEVKAIYGNITPGKMFAAMLQASDMLHAQVLNKPMPVLIPVGVDQDPHIRLARDISQKIKQYKFIQLSSSYHLFIPGLKGGKMSASDPSSFIALTDTPAQVKKKINKYAFSGGQPTLEEHREKGGNPDIDVSFQYLRAIFEPNDEKLKQIENDYKSGKMLTGELKKILIEKTSVFLENHQKEREKAKTKINEYLDN